MAADNHDYLGDFGDGNFPDATGSTDAEAAKSRWISTVEAAWDTHKTSVWDMADLVNQGLDAFAKSTTDRFVLLDEVSEQLELARKTIENYCRIALVFPKHYRVWPNLTIHHYGTVVGLMGEDEEIAFAWLRKAAEHGWSVEKLRQQMKTKAEPDSAEDSDTIARPSMEALFAEVEEWGAETFPDGSIYGTIKHLQRELDELLVAQTYDEARHEVADVFILGIQIARLVGVNVYEAVSEKMAMNRTRRWAEPDADGVIEHIREDVDDADDADDEVQR